MVIINPPYQRPRGGQNVIDVAGVTEEAGRIEGDARSLTDLAVLGNGRRCYFAEGRVISCILPTKNSEVVNTWVASSSVQFPLAKR